MNTNNDLPVDGFSSTGNIFLSNPMKFSLCRGSLIEVIFMAVGENPLKIGISVLFVAERVQNDDRRSESKNKRPS